jgi:hypothetical protein
MSKESDADPDLSFSTAADLRGESSPSGGGEDGPTADGSTFTDLQHPNRTFTRAGGMRYEGATVFELRPAAGAPDEAALATLAEDVLSTGPYRYGDWFDLPLPVFLVHDDGSGDTFRVAVRDDAVELHVRSDTSARGLRGFYERLVAASDRSTGGPAAPDRTEDGWLVSRRTE